MGVKAEEPLLVDVWLRELHQLRNVCTRGNAEDADRVVRRAFHIRALSPRPMQRMFPLTISEDDLEELLDRGESEAAARALVGDDWAIAISPSPIKGRVVARLSGRRGSPLEAAASCPAMAIIGAWIHVLAGASPSSMPRTGRVVRAPITNTRGNTLLRTA